LTTIWENQLAVTTSAPTPLDQLRYPTGKFHRPKGALDDTERKRIIDVIGATPKSLADAVRGLNEKQLDTPYRTDGWTVRQVVHHVADSHMNAYVRLKLALTEDAPLVKPYDEAAWAKLVDSRDTPADVSLALITALHDRWVRVMRAMRPGDFARTMTHPEHGSITVDYLLALYAWHGPHHVGHITALREREHW
jgi:uncharacterized damage-inducible protein DinB